MAADTRERILEAACDLIAADGIDDVRIARVAMRAGISTALVHHYFSTREELLEQALIHSFEGAGDERFGVEAGAGERRSAAEVLGEAIAASLPFPGQARREWVLWVELWLRAVRDPALQPVAAGALRALPRVDGGVDRGRGRQPASSSRGSRSGRSPTSRSRCSTAPASGR